jgi:hypothetical protein
MTAPAPAARRRATGLAAVALLPALTAPWSAGAAGAAGQPSAESREVRQIVTFRFLPGQTQAALDLYRGQVLPLYRETEAMRTVRFLGEAESPEPLDLMVVTHYQDMAAMDRANRTLAERPADGGPSIGLLYKQIGDLGLGHTDQFVEMLSPVGPAPPPDGRLLEVLEFLRVTPGTGPGFERQVLGVVHPWEQDTPVRDIVLRTETARFLVADSWDYLRTYTIRDLAAWQAYTAARSRNPAMYSVNRFVEARKTMILREHQDLRVR